MPPQESANDDIRKLLEETLAVARENNRLLREMRRNALLGLVARVIIWLILLGVPLFFLSSYIGPLIEAASGTGTSGLPNGLLGLPSGEQLNQLIEEYQAAYQ